MRMDGMSSLMPFLISRRRRLRRRTTSHRRHHPRARKKAKKDIMYSAGQQNGELEENDEFMSRNQRRKR